MRHALLWGLALSGLIGGVGQAAPPGLTDAVRRALEQDPGLRASGVRVRETQAAEQAAGGRFDLVGQLNLDAATDRFTARDQTRDTLLALDTTRLTLDAGLLQPLVWGTQIRAGWIQVYTQTDNPFRNCVPGVASDQCFESRLQLRVNQPLLRGFGREINEIQARRARADRGVALAERAATAEALAEQVSQAFVELAYARAEQEIRAQALALAETQLDLSQRRVKGGQLAAAELPVVAQAVAQRRRALFLAEQAVADRVAELEEWIGPVPEDTAARLPEARPWAEGDAEVVAERAVDAQPDLQVQDARIRRQQAELVALRDATRAQLDVGLVAAQTGIDDGALGGAVANIPDNGSHFYGATVAFEFPFANTTAEARLAEARLGVERARLEREARARTLRRTAAAAWRRVQSAEVAERLARQVAALSSQTVQAEQRRLELGRSTNLAVLQIQQEAAEAELAVARAASDRLLALASLRRQTGTLLEDHGLEIAAVQELAGGPRP